MKHLLAAAALSALAAAAQAEGMTHKVAIHVDQNDRDLMNMALGNVVNLTRHQEERGDAITVEIVTHGPGGNMLRTERTSVLDRISAMALGYEGRTFSACQNPLDGMARHERREIELIPEATTVPSGVVRPIELQEEGYA